VSVKRLNYFTHQLLREQDFKDEQQYNLEMRRRHNRLFHSWGVVEGLEVTPEGERAVSISPGMAIDGEGREIVLLRPVRRDLGDRHRDSHVFITMSYGELWDEADHHTAGGVDGYTRVSEAPEFVEHDHQPPSDGSVVILARVHINDVGHVGHIEMGPSVRKRAIPPSPAAGWVRLPFKPHALNPVRVSGRLVRVVNEEVAQRFEFIVDEASAYCDSKGARGSMDIPVPPGAVRITGFRIAATTLAAIRVHLYRVGWSSQTNSGEKTMLLDETFSGQNFHKELHVNSPLDDTHGLAVSVMADGEATIWLVAARFE
jgi:hypothetical protein